MDLEARNRTIDALRYTMQDLDRCIDSMRKKMRRGRPFNRLTYPDLVRRASELREACVNEYGCYGPLIDLVDPIPYHTGFIGRSAEEVAAIEWIGAGDVFGGRTVNLNSTARIAA